MNQIHTALQHATKEELIDIIEERLCLDPVFRRTIENRFLSKDKSASEQIAAFKNQIEEEMSMGHPDTSVLRSACFNLKRAMDSWSVYDVVLANVAIIRALDSALCNGAGMEDETDFQLNMDAEEARDNAIKKIKEKQLTVREKKKITELLEKEQFSPLDVFGRDFFEDIMYALIS